MSAQPTLWRAVRWPLALLAVAAAGIAVATVMDQTSARESSLVIGAPALTVLLPLGLVWLVSALVLYAARRRGRASSG